MKPARYTYLGSIKRRGRSFDIYLRFDERYAIFAKDARRKPLALADSFRGIEIAIEAELEDRETDCQEGEPESGSPGPVRPPTRPSTVHYT